MLINVVNMNLSNLKPARGSVRTNKRVGRGYGSGNGKTAGRGMNGARSRAGYSKKIGFEGGQMPLYRIIPKFGFKNRSRVEYSAINLDTLEKLSKEKGITEFNLTVLAEHGLVSSKDLVKILGRGEISGALKVEAHAFSAKAKEIIESKGGSVSISGAVSAKE